MNPQVSIIIPSIRICNLEKVYNSILGAAKNTSFEVIVISPYLNIPELLLKTGKVRFIHSYANPSVAAQIGFSLAIGQLIYNFTDDCLMQENVVDKAIQFIIENNLKQTDVLNMRYIEDTLNLDLSFKKEPIPFPDSYWQTKTYPDFYLPGVNLEWNLAPHFLMDRELFNYLGGLDCQFEYLNWNLHDICFRIQSDKVGGKIYQSPFTTSLASHLPGKTGDHAPIDISNEFDKIKFKQIYSNPEIYNKRIRIPLDNWKLQPQIWERRFDKNNLPLHK